MKHSTQASVAQAIRVQRVRAGIPSEAELARRAGLSPSALSKRLAGDIRLDLTDIERLADALGLPFHPVVRKVKENRPQKVQQNRYHQCHNLDGVFAIEGPIPSGPVLLIEPGAAQAKPDIPTTSASDANPAPVICLIFFLVILPPYLSSSDDGICVIKAVQPTPRKGVSHRQA